jgi:polysaccharide biosynthesis transport protein
MKKVFSDASDSGLIRPQDSSELSFSGGDFPEIKRNEELSLGILFVSLRKYWYVSALLSSLIMAGVVYKTAKEPRVYKSSVQIAIELKNSSTLAEKITSGNSVSNDDRITNIETITQILKSKTVVKKAIDTISDKDLRPPVGKVLADLNIASGQNTNILTITYTDTVPERIVSVLNALSRVYIDDNVESRKARTNSSLAFIESQLPKARKRLEDSSRGLEEFRQKHRFVDPESSAQKSTAYRQELVAKLNAIKVQSDQTQKQSEELQKQLTAVGLKSNNILSTTMLTQDSAYQELFKKLNELDLIYSQERVRFSDENSLVISAKEKRDAVLVLLKRRAQQVLNRVVPDDELTNGGIANFSNNLAQNLANKQAEIETTAASLAAEYKSLYEVYQKLELEIAQLPTLQKQYTELQRQYNIYSQEVTSFLQKSQELKISNAEQVVPWKLLDPPEPPGDPISPNVPRQLGLGAIGSLFIGLLAAIGLNRLDNRIENPDVIKSMIGLPVLTLLPDVRSLDRVVTQGKTAIGNAKNGKKNNNYSYWSFVESVRNLAMAIGLKAHTGEAGGKVIAMTSAISKEGKSTVTFYTSIALAELGYRVLLVDVDLYKSSINQLCKNSVLFQAADCSDGAGLTDVLLGKSTWGNLVKKSPRLGLEILFSGHKPIHSISLLNSSLFKGLIDEWKQQYDYVIFDTPPVMGVSDTRLIGTLVDGLVYIVSAQAAQRQTISRALETIALMGTPVLGVAINRVENRYSGYGKNYQSDQSPNELMQAVETIKIPSNG